MTSLGLVWGLVGWCFYRVLNQDESNETIAHPVLKSRGKVSAGHWLGGGLKNSFWVKSTLTWVIFTHIMGI